MSLLPARLNAHIERIAAESTVPGCWACTLLRVSIRLRSGLLAFALGTGLIWGFLLGAMFDAWVLR